MNREEQIVEAGKLAASDNKFSDLAMKQHRVMSAYELGFIDGAVWADKNYNWISVADELPECSATVLCHFVDGGMDICNLYGSDFFDYVGENVTRNITHWIPLPAPPKKGGEK